MDEGWRLRLRLVRLAEDVADEARRNGSDRMVRLAEAMLDVTHASLEEQEAKLLALELPGDDARETVLLAVEAAHARRRRVEALLSEERARFNLN